MGTSTERTSQLCLLVREEGMAEAKPFTLCHTNWILFHLPATQKDQRLFVLQTNWPEIKNLSGWRGWWHLWLRLLFVFVGRFNIIKTKLEIVSEVKTFPGVAVKWKYILLWNSVYFFLCFAPTFKLPWWNLSHPSSFSHVLQSASHLSCRFSLLVSTVLKWYSLPCRPTVLLRKGPEMQKVTF